MEITTRAAKVISVMQHTVHGMVYVRIQCPYGMYGRHTHLCAFPYAPDGNYGERDSCGLSYTVTADARTNRIKPFII